MLVFGDLPSNHHETDVLESFHVLQRVVRDGSCQRRASPPVGSRRADPRQVDMTVDESKQHEFVAQIDHCRARIAFGTEKPIAHCADLAADDHQR